MMYTCSVLFWFGFWFGVFFFSNGELYILWSVTSYFPWHLTPTWLSTTCLWGSFLSGSVILSGLAPEGSSSKRGNSRQTGERWWTLKSAWETKWLWLRSSFSHLRPQLMPLVHMHPLRYADVNPSPMSLWYLLCSLPTDYRKDPVVYSHPHL